MIQKLFLFSSIVLLLFFTTAQSGAASDIEIKMSKNVQFQLDKKIRLEVIKGEAKLTFGTTLQAGSDFRINEDELVYQPEMKIRVGSGGITLKGIFYKEGSELLIDAQGNIKRKKKWILF